LCLERCVIQEPSSSRLEEHTAGIRAVDRCVAKRACLILHCLVVERGNRGCAWIDSQGMALEAKKVDLAALEEAGVRRAVRRVARGATIDLYNWMLEDKWAGLLGMALKANGVARRSCA